MAAPLDDEPAVSKMIRRSVDEINTELTVAMGRVQAIREAFEDFLEWLDGEYPDAYQRYLEHLKQKAVAAKEKRRSSKKGKPR